jgi:hypothetical protein
MTKNKKKNFINKLISLIFIIGINVLFSCTIFDNSSDIIISISPPDKIIIENNANVSTLRKIKIEIIRNNESVYIIDRNCNVPAGEKEIIQFDDFMILTNDTIRIIDTNFEWDM